MSNYINFFGFQKEPFPQNIPLDGLYFFPGLDEINERCFYTVEIGMIHIITGPVGSGKSTSLNFAASKFHPSKFKIIPIIAHTGSNIELLKQIAFAFNLAPYTNSITKLTRSIRSAFSDIFRKRMTPVLLIDEAHLLREKIFRELHNLLQNGFRSDITMPLILCGQLSLIDKLKFYTAEALASRVIGRSHLKGLDLAHTSEYLMHHLNFAGIKDDIFAQNAILAIHQGSGGIMRKANNLARGALIAAASKKSRLVSAEHVRLASTELF